MLVANIIVKIKNVMRGVEDVAPYKSCLALLREGRPLPYENIKMDCRGGVPPPENKLLSRVRAGDS